MPEVLPEEVAALLGRLGGVAARRDLQSLGVLDNDLRRWVRRGLLVRVRDGTYAVSETLESKDLIPLISDNLLPRCVLARMSS